MSCAVDWCCIFSSMSMVVQGRAGVHVTPVMPCNGLPCSCASFCKHVVGEVVLLCVAVRRGARRWAPELGGRHQPASLLGAGRAAGRVAGLPAAPGRLWPLGRPGVHHLLAGARPELCERPALETELSSKHTASRLGCTRMEGQVAAATAVLSPLNPGSGYHLRELLVSQQH